MRRLLVIVIAVATVAAGCKRKRPDEEILRKKVDATPVHLYLSAKVALGGTEEAEAKAAREQILTLIATAAAMSRPTGEAAPADAAAPAISAVGLVKSLWTLRRIGQDALKQDRDDHPRPVLPVIVKTFVDASVPSDPAFEHGALMAGLTLLKLHPRSPVPVPEEILLYETWKARPERFAEYSLEAPLRSLRSYNLALSELCDLSAGEVRQIPVTGALVDPEKLARGLQQLGGNAPPLTMDQAAAADAAFRMVGEGSTALCYYQRKEYDEAHRYLGQFLDSAERVGLKSEEMDLLRAYLDCAEGDAEVGKKRLLELQTTAKGEQKEVIDSLVKICGTSRGSKLAKQLDRAMFASALARVAFEQLERSGLDEKLRQSPVHRAVQSFLVGVGGSIGKAREAIPSAGDLKEQAKGWISKEGE